MKRSDCPWCWACGEPAPRKLCEYCDAPPWAGTVIDHPVDRGGVYLIAAECGLWKIGLSNLSVADRTDDLIRKAKGRGENEHVVYSLEPEFWAPPEVNFARVPATDTGEAA